MIYKTIEELDKIIDGATHERWSNAKDDDINELRIYILELQAEHMTFESKIRMLEKENEKLEIELQKERQVTNTTV